MIRGGSACRILLVLVRILRIVLLATSTTPTNTNPLFVLHQKAENKRPAIGLAVNGGSLRAANGNGGIMRGFQQQRVMIDGEEKIAMEAFEFVSGLSGGNVPNFLYHFARNTDSDELLDAKGTSDPSKVTIEDLENIPEKSMFKPMASDFINNMFSSIIDNILTGNLFLTNLLSRQFLQYFGMQAGELASDLRIRDGVKSTPLFETAMVGPSELFPDWVYTHMNKGLIDDINLNGPQNLEIFVEGGAFGTMYHQNLTYVLEVAKKYGYQIPIPAFGTHEKLHVQFQEATLEFDSVNNVTSEPLDYKPFTAAYGQLSSESNPFTMEKVLGMATDLIAIIAPSLIAQYPLFAPFFADSPTVDIPTANGDTRNMAFSDGGYIDGSGIPALLVQKPRKIIYGDVGNFPVPYNSPESIILGLQSLFGIIMFPMTDPQDPVIGFTAAQKALNHVFDVNSNGENQVKKLFDNMKSLYEAGEPMITTLEGLDVVHNPFWGIEGGWKVDLTIIYLCGVPTKFAEQLPDDIAPPPFGRNLTEGGYFTNEEFKDVPNLPSNRAANLKLNIPLLGIDFDEIIPGLGFDLDPKAARISHILASWSIDRAWDGLKGIDGETKFTGFRTMFEEAIIGENTKTVKNAKSTKSKRSIWEYPGKKTRRMLRNSA